jgi:hypothetical protein
MSARGTWLGRLRAETTVDGVRRRLLAESYPRVQMSSIVAIAALFAFLCSAALLGVGLATMAVRYALAAVLGYGAFLLLIRAWIAYQQRRWDVDLDLPLDAIDLPRGGGPGGSPDEPFTPGGGSFGGGGAGRSFDEVGPLEAAPIEVAYGAPSSSGGAADWAPDLDPGDAWPLVVALVLLLGGVAAMGFVVYASPVLFAEVLLDAAVAGAIYRRARRRSRAHWLRGVFRRTWLPALGLCAFAAGAGFLVQAAIPDARSLGDLVRAVVS